MYLYCYSYDMNESFDVMLSRVMYFNENMMSWIYMYMYLESLECLFLPRGLTINLHERRKSKHTINVPSKFPM